jgi:hypothetical protein
MYITEEWFLKDLLRTYVMTDNGDGSSSCQVYDTFEMATGGEG